MSGSRTARRAELLYWSRELELTEGELRGDGVEGTLVRYSWNVIDFNCYST